MSSQFEFNGIEWEASGYFGCPVPFHITEFPSELMDDLWLTWVVALDEAKKGRFANLQKLLQIYKKTRDLVLRKLCTVLLGDAGPTSSFSAIVNELKVPYDPNYYERAIHFCGALAARGRLADVPLLLEVYKRYATISDADIVPIYMSDILEPEPQIISDPTECFSMDEYSSVVMACYNEVAEKLGTNDVLVIGGERFSVVRLAQKMLDEEDPSYFLDKFRRKFEAATGIDCTNFYKDSRLQPLAAAAIVEEFLETPKVDKYEDGVRYFFGHRILD